MAGELSPDRLFFWDGKQWVSAISADDAWQWDGSAWRPAARPARTKLASRWRMLIAAGTVVTLLVVSAGTYFAWALFNRTVQSVVGQPCTSPLAQPGAALTRGETLCGGKLGEERLLADCTLTDGTPAGIDVWKKNYATAPDDWVPSSVTGGPDGCMLAAPPNTDLTFASHDEEPASTVVVADFKVIANVGGSYGVELACVEAGTCVDITIYSDGLYRLDEYRPDGSWINLTKGYTLFGGAPRSDRFNRVILRLTGRQVAVLMNGIELTRASTKYDQTPGGASFYVDNRSGKSLESALLQRMYVFDSQ